MSRLFLDYFFLEFSILNKIFSSKINLKFENIFNSKNFQNIFKFKIKNSPKAYIKPQARISDCKNYWFLNFKIQIKTIISVWYSSHEYFYNLSKVWCSIYFYKFYFVQLFFIIIFNKKQYFDIQRKKFLLSYWW